MHRQRIVCHVLAALLGLAHRAPAEEETRGQAGTAVEGVSLEELEEMALARNPTLKQAGASVRAAEGRTLQAGLYPNPIMGYMGEELAFRAPTPRDEHLFFMEQAIVTAGKLRHSRSVSEQEQRQVEAEAEAQRLRVLNAVRILYYEVLGAQETVQLRTQLAEITRDAETTSRQLFNVGAADRPDLLEAQIELHQAEIDLLEAENDLRRAWQMLAAVVGDPLMEPAPVRGDLEAQWPRLDRDSVLAGLLERSPEIARAQAGVERARAALRRARSEPVPDLLLRGGIGHNKELSDFPDVRVGPEAFIEVGIRVPLFDRNQGNVAAAAAEIDRAEQEVRRLELELRTRMAMAYDRHLDALTLAERYREEMLPRAQEAHELYLARFQEMGAAYPLVLIAQRTLFQVRVDYVKSLVELWQTAALLRGMLLAGGLEPPRTSGS